MDTKEPANTRLTNGYDLYGWVMRQSGFPSFWARPVSGRNKLTPEEAAFLHERNCRVIPVFDDLSEAAVAGVNGSGDALRAADAARTAGVPANRGIAIFARIKDGWNINHNWMIGFTNTLLNNGYIPGYIGNTDSSKDFNFDRQCSHYINFMGEIAKDSTAYWATEPRPGVPPTAWAPYCPSSVTPEEIDLWSTGGKVMYKDILFKKVYARGESVRRFMW